MRRLFFRPLPQSPDLGLPMAARSVGCYEFGSEGYGEVCPGRPIIEFFWGQSGSGSLHYENGEQVELSADVVAWYPPGERHELRAKGPWSYRWWTMDGPQALSLCHASGWSTRRWRRVGPCPVAVFERLAVELQQLGREHAASASAYALLMAASAKRNTEQNPLADACAQLIKQHASDPQCSVESLAKRLGCHRATLSKHCQQSWGSPVSAALQNERLRIAVDLLLSSTSSIAQIAKQSGYSDPAYFSRQLKKATGLAPRELRSRQKRAHVSG